MDDLIRKLCARAQDEREAVERVLREFFSHCNGVWSHKRADKELEKYRALSEQQRARVSKRWSKNTDGIPTVSENVPTVSEGIPNGYQEPYTGAGIPTKNQEPRTKNHSIPPSPPVGGKGRKEKAVDWFEFLPVELNSDKFKTAWLEWVEYRKAIKKPVNPASAPAFFRRAVEAGVDAALAGMELSMANGWQGVFHEQKSKHDHRSEKRSREFSEQLVVPDFE